MDVHPVNQSTSNKDIGRTRTYSANVKRSSYNAKDQLTQSSQSQQSHNQLDQIKELFQNPLQVAQKMSQRKTGIEENSQEYLQNNIKNHRSIPQKKEECIDYSIEIKKNNISPSIDEPVLKSILGKHTQQRNINELNFVKECLSHLEIFKSWNEDQLISQSFTQTEEQKIDDQQQALLIYKYLFFRSFNKYTALFFQDDLPRECYAILKGEVLVLQKENHRKEKKSEQQIKQMLKDFELDIEEYNKILELYPHNTIIGRIKQGRLFGEIALYYQETRTATVICISDELQVGCLDSNSFKITLKAQVGRQTQRILDFLSSISLFKGIDDNQLNVLALSCDVIQRNINTILYKEKQPIDYVYFVINGEVEISQSIQQKVNQSANQANSINDSSNRSLDKSNYQSKNTDEVYDDDEQIVQDVKEAFLLNKFYKPQNIRSKSNGERLSQHESNISDNIKKLQQLAEERQYNYIRFKKNSKQNISFIVGRSEIFGCQIENCEKRTSSAKVISSSIQLARIKSSVFFDIIVNSFSKTNPNNDIMKALSMKNAKLEQHRGSNLITKQQIFEMIEKESKKEKISNELANYSDEVQSSSISTVLENIKNARYSFQKRPSKIKEDNSPQFSQMQSQCFFRTRKLSQHSNQHYEGDQSVGTPTSQTVPIKRQSQESSFSLLSGKQRDSFSFSSGQKRDSFSIQSTQKRESVSQQSGQKRGSTMNRTLFNKSLNSPHNFITPDESNIIRGSIISRDQLVSRDQGTTRSLTATRGQAVSRSSLSTFSSAFQAAQSTSQNLEVQKNTIQENGMVSPSSMAHTPSAFGMNQTNNVSTPQSAKGINRPSSRSLHYVSKQLFSNRKGSVDASQDTSAIETKERSSMYYKPLQFNHLVQSFGGLDSNRSLNEVNTQSMTTQNVINVQESQTIPLSTNSHFYPNADNSQQFNPNNQKLNTPLGKKNSIFDILYPDLVTQVNRQIGVLKNQQLFKNSDARQSISYKPQVNTIKQNENRQIPQSTPSSPLIQKLNIPQNRSISPIPKESQSPIKMQLQEHKQDVEQHQMGQKLNQQMCVTYKHLNLHKMFPQSAHSTQAKQYFASVEKEFKNKMENEKKQIKLKNQQIPYMQMIEKKINAMNFNKTKDSFNFVQKKNN